MFKPEGILRKLKNCHFSQFYISFCWWIWWHIKEVFLNDITTKYIIATDLVLRHRSSIHESEFIKRLLLMSLSNEAVHQPQQHSAVGIHLKSFLMKLMNWQPNEKSLSQISKSPHYTVGKKFSGSNPIRGKIFKNQIFNHLSRQK